MGVLTLSLFHTRLQLIVLDAPVSPLSSACLCAQTLPFFSHAYVDEAESTPSRSLGIRKYIHVFPSTMGDWDKYVGSLPQKRGGGVSLDQL